MSNLHSTTSLLGLGLAVLIIYLLRRDHLYILHGMFWILIAALALVLGFWPKLIDWLADLTGIVYPPALLLLLANIVLFIKSLHSDIMNTRLERQVRRLNQRLALLELETQNQQDVKKGRTLFAPTQE